MLADKAVAEVIGDCVNRGAGYGLEMPYIYRLYGSKAYLHKSVKFSGAFKLTNECCNWVTILWQVYMMCANIKNMTGVH